MNEMTQQIVSAIYNSLSDKIYKNLDEICFFFMLDEVLDNPKYLKFIISKYNYQYLLKPSSYEDRFKEHLPPKKPYLMNAELSRLLGHELDEIILAVQIKMLLRNKRKVEV